MFKKGPFFSGPFTLCWSPTNKQSLSNKAGQLTGFVVIVGRLTNNHP
jgi:hypothetical protein